MTGLGPLSLSPSKHKGWRAKNGKGRKCKHKNIHKYASYKGKGGQRDKERPFKMIRKLFPVPSVPAQSFLFNAAKGRKMQQNALPCSGCSVRSRVVGYGKNIFSVKANKATKNQKISSSTKNKHEFFTTPIKRPSLGFRGIALTGSFEGGIFIDCQF